MTEPAKTPHGAGPPPVEEADGSVNWPLTVDYTERIDHLPGSIRMGAGAEAGGVSRPGFAERAGAAAGRCRWRGGGFVTESGETVVD